MNNIASAATNKAKAETLMNNYGYRFADPKSGGDGSGNSPVNYDAIALNSISYKKEFVGEAVPRHTKKCGDLVLQGSNNTVISLTHADNVGTGTIVLAAGKSLGGNSIVKNKRGTSAKSIEHEEVQKFAGVFGRGSDTVDEGTVDTASASIVITETAGGSVKIGNSAGAYIELKTNGDICIVPSGEGVVRLGGEDADKALVSQIATDNSGNVTANGLILTSAGGTFGEGDPTTLNLASGPPIPLPGKFASKILVK